MKAQNLIISGLIFIILISSCYAECKAPDIMEHKQCIAKCEGGLVMSGDCGSYCTAQFQEKQDAYIECTEQEKKTVEQTIVQELQANNQDNIGVSKSKGKVSIQQADGTWKEIAVDTVLKDGDVIKSDKKSTVSIVLADGHTITLAPESKFIYHEDTNSYSISLMYGKMRFWLKKHLGKLDVRTPVAIGAIRGTDFILEHDAVKNITTIYLYEGIVDVTNLKNETFGLNAGEIMAMDSSGKTVKSELSEDNWTGLVNSIETEEKPAYGKQTTTYFIAITIVVLIALGILLAKKFKKKQ